MTVATIVEGLDSGSVPLIEACHADLLHARLLMILRLRFILPRGTLDKAMDMVEAPWWTVGLKPST
jgi:hypothetical protein